MPTVSADGTKVELVCNIGKPEDAKKAVECDGEGIGLSVQSSFSWTEIQFLQRKSSLRHTNQ